MYVVRLEAAVFPGKIRELEALSAQAFAMAKEQPGFLRGGVGNSLGYPLRYTSLSVWESREASEVFRRSDAYQRWLLANPLGMVATATRPVEAYETVARVQERDIGDAGFIALTDVTVDLGKTQLFEERSQELLDLRKKIGHGLISSTLTRFLGGGGRYLGYSVYTDREAARRTLVTPEIQTFMQAHPVSEFGATITNMDACAVILVAVPAVVA